MQKTFTLSITFLVLLLVLVAAIGCSDRAKPVTRDPVFARSATNAEQNEGLAKQLLLEKLHIDALSLDTLAPALVFTKVPGKDTPVPVQNRQYPKQIEAIYQVCKDSLGHIVYLAESPFSKSGDWDIVYRSYYDAGGRIFAFERTAGFYNSTCTAGPLYQNLTKFFNAQGQVIATEQTYTDEQGATIKDQPCDFPYNFPYEVVTDVTSYCRKIKLRL